MGYSHLTLCSQQGGTNKAKLGYTRKSFEAKPAPTKMAHGLNVIQIRCFILSRIRISVIFFLTPPLKTQKIF